MLARTPRDLGLMIREQRRKLGLEQRELAQRIGVSRQWVVEVEKGKPRAELALVLRALAALELALDVSPRDQSPPAAPDPAWGVDLDEVLARARGKVP